MARTTAETTRTRLDAVPLTAAVPRTNLPAATPATAFRKYGSAMERRTATTHLMNRTATPAIVPASGATIMNVFRPTGAATKRRTVPMPPTSWTAVEFKTLPLRRQLLVVTSTRADFLALMDSVFFLPRFAMTVRIAVTAPTKAPSVRSTNAAKRNAARDALLPPMVLRAIATLVSAS